jgi:FixJ family two-component response regulator
LVSKEKLIAVIDDDRAFREALVESLFSLGYGARAFASAEEFLALDERGACCVITDVHMPGMSGLDLKRALRAREDSIPVIMVTARKEPNLEAKTAASGAICLLRKPFGTEALLGGLKKALHD